MQQRFQLFEGIFVLKHDLTQRRPVNTAVVSLYRIAKLGHNRLLHACVLIHNRVGNLIRIYRQGTCLSR